MLLACMVALGQQSAQAERAEDSLGLISPDVPQKAATQNTPAPKASSASSPEFTQGVKAYREGDYISARRTFYGLHRQHPEDSRATYYLAITEAQLGRFQNAKKLYEEILTLDPNGEAASHARNGLQYLPSDTGLDLPPRFHTVEKPDSALQTSPQAAGQGQAGLAPQGMSQQDWLAWQMMMGQTGMSGNNNNMGNTGFGMTPWMMPQAGGSDPNSPNGYDPNAMSNMLMNQMLQNFSLEGNKDDNR